MPIKFQQTADLVELVDEGHLRCEISVFHVLDQLCFRAGALEEELFGADDWEQMVGEVLTDRWLAPKDQERDVTVSPRPELGKVGLSDILRHETDLLAGLAAKLRRGSRWDRGSQKYSLDWQFAHGIPNVRGITGAVLASWSPNCNDCEVALTQLGLGIGTVGGQVVFNEFSVAAE